MVYATCLNEDCTKDEWWLKKPPSEYASGGPKCPECGTTRVSVGDGGSEPDAAQPAQHAEEAQPAQAPAKRQEADDAGGALATEREALSTGAKVGKMIAGLSADSPEEQAATQGKLMTALGSTVASMGQEMTEKRMNEIERSKQADESSISAVDDYVSCPDCGTQITELPEPGTQFRCPGCNQLLQSQ